MPPNHTDNSNGRALETQAGEEDVTAYSLQMREVMVKAYIALESVPSAQQQP